MIKIYDLFTDEYISEEDKDPSAPPKRYIETELKPVPLRDLDEITRAARNSEYYRGRVDGMEYVIDALVEAYKRSRE